MMKQISSFLAFFLFACLTLTAQATYGVKAGLYASDVISNKVFFAFDGNASFEHRFKAETVIRPQFGLWGNFQLNKRFSLQPELLYTSKAWLPENTEGAEPLYFDYLSFPILLNYQLSNWRVEVGPEISYLLRQYFKEEVGIFGNKNPFVDEQVFELGVNAGISYHLKQFSLGLRYQLDYTPFVTFEQSDVNGTPIPNSSIRQYHQGLQLSLGYSFVSK